MLGNATVSRLGIEPPERVSLEAGASLDDKANPALALDMIRLIVANAFDSDLYDKAAAIPSRLLALVFPAGFLPQVIRTLGVAVHAAGVSCIMRVRMEAVEDFCRASLLQGAFV